MKKVYISLPISGHNLNDVRRRIEDVSELLKSKGYIPVSPLEVQSNLNAPYSELMGNDIKALLECDAIILLDGWENSKGCRLEKYAASLYNKPVFIKELIYKI
ncbi:DUF4406 domain-containing protein [Bacteroides thetaiotaomicron]|uniref:DUF4406 domain-containing protein n=1 Tax=Bacteroides thetaiotaomicron TaxID=818 RepID=UPI0039C482B9